jgi:predicted secreted protein
LLILHTPLKKKKKKKKILHENKNSITYQSWGLTQHDRGKIEVSQNFFMNVTKESTVYQLMKFVSLQLEKKT